MRCERSVLLSDERVFLAALGVQFESVHNPDPCVLYRSIECGCAVDSSPDIREVQQVGDGWNDVRGFDGDVGYTPGRPIGRLHEEWHRGEVTDGLLLYDTLGEPRLEREPVIGCDDKSGLAVEIQTLQPVDQGADHLVDE